MATDRCVKWSTDAQGFFDSYADNSVDLDIIVSYACVSQNGNGFEELVNSLNSEKISRKLRKINLLDSSYLYRHVIPTFSKYSNPEMPTEWFLNNRHIIEKLHVAVNLRSWANEVSSDLFKRWHRQIIIDYAGNENGKGIVQEFRDLVVADSAIAAHKSGKNIQNCIDFMLEECAHACANFRSPTNLVYPMKIASSVENVAKRYNICINHFRYRASVQTHDNSSSVIMDSDRIDRRIALFMKENVSNVNFFVIDKYGNHIYKNYAYDSLVGEINFGRLDPKSWITSLDVMNSKKQQIVQEEYNGVSYISVKAPLIINDKVEGVIGLAVDITDRIKAEKLEIQNKLQRIKLKEQEEFKRFAASVAHDISSPLASLECFAKACKNLTVDQNDTLTNIVSGIRNIANDLLNRYLQDQEAATSEKIQSLLIPSALSEIVNQKVYQDRKMNVKLRYFYDPAIKLTFVKIDLSNFSRMISNLIDNSFESFEDQSGVIDISLSADDQNVRIIVKDNGRGMPKSLVEKINQRIPVATTKKHGHGIGLVQIMNTLNLYNGKLFVESEIGIGTTIAITFPKSEHPSWIAEQITLQNGDTIVIVDNDEAIYSVWKILLKCHLANLDLKFFASARDAENFIDSSVNKSGLFLLADLGLRNNGLSWLHVILQNEIRDRALIVTDDYSNKTLQDFAEKTGIKILPKQLVGNVKITFMDCQACNSYGH
ncbi:MAG: GHKL domain-containing protein [Holosporaceae bacterium]|jgi:signal transduction histidine kinase|nr:GHKL domain-containing protein [Holosporaceae bacterium]